MKKSIIIAAALCCVTQVNAQIPLNMEWTASLGNDQPMFVFPRGIVLDGASNTYSTGSVEYPAGSFIYVTKTDASGNVLWSRQLGNAEMNGNSGYSVALDPAGNVVVVGEYKSTVDFDPDVFGVSFLNSGINGNVFALKLDANGNFIWVKGLIAGGEAFGWEDLTMDAVGNMVLSGNFEGTGDFDPGVGVYNMSAVGQQAGFIIRLDANGQFSWAKKLDALITAGGSVVPRGIGSDANGNIVVGGYFNGTIDFDPGLSNATATADWTDAFMVKLNSAGQMIWKKTFGGSGYDALMDLTVESEGRVFVTGNFQNTVVFDPFGTQNAVLTAYGSTGAFVGKYNQDGFLNWVDQLGGASGLIYPYAITIDVYHNVYTTGWFQGTIDFQPLDVSESVSGPATENVLSDVYELTAEYEDTYVSMLDKGGAFLSAGSFAGTSGGISSSRGRGIAVSGCHIYTTGPYEQAVDFDMGSMTYNLYSVNQAGYINKTSSCNQIKKNAEVFNDSESGNYTDLIVFPNPVEQQLTIRRETDTVGQTYELFAANGVKVKSGTLDGNEFVLDISDLDSGMYTLVVEGTSYRVVKM